MTTPANADSQLAGSDECAQTIKELREYFSEAAIIEGLAQAGVSAPTSGPALQEKICQSLRAFAVLVIESDRPRLTAILIGKLVGLELATNTRLIQRDLARTHGTSKQAISKRLAYYADKLDLPRPDSTEESRKAHRLMNRRNYVHAEPRATANA